MYFCSLIQFFEKELRLHSDYHSSKLDDSALVCTKFKRLKGEDYGNRY